MYIFYLFINTLFCQLNKSVYSLTKKKSSMVYLFKLYLYKYILYIHSRQFKKTYYTLYHIECNFATSNKIYLSIPTKLTKKIDFKSANLLFSMCKN